MRVKYKSNAIEFNHIDGEYLLRGENQLFLVGNLGHENNWEMTNNPDRKLVVGVLFNKVDNEEFYCYEHIIDYSENKYIREEISPRIRYYLSEGIGNWVTVINQHNQFEVMESTGYSNKHMRITDNVEIL